MSNREDAGGTTRRPVCERAEGTRQPACAVKQLVTPKRQTPKREIGMLAMVPGGRFRRSKHHTERRLPDRAKPVGLSVRRIALVITSPESR